MTKYERFLTKYADINDYLNTIAKNRVAFMLRERRLYALRVQFAEREGIKKGFVPLISRVINDDGGIESVKVLYFPEIDQETQIPVNQNATVIELTPEEENALKRELTLKDGARRNFETVIRAGAMQILGGNEDYITCLDIAQDSADRIAGLITIADADKWQDLCYKEIQALEDITPEERDTLIYLFAVNHTDKDSKTKQYQYSAICSNFLNWVAFAIPLQILNDRHSPILSMQDTEQSREIVSHFRKVRGLINETVRGVGKAWNKELDLPLEEETGLQLFAENPKTEIISRYFVPDNYTQNITKTRQIFDPKYRLEELAQIEFDLLPNSKKVCLSNFSLMPVNTEENGVIVHGKPTRFDEAVANAVYSIADTGQLLYTARQVANIVYHGSNQNKSGISPNQEGAITKSINKMRNLYVTISATEYGRASDTAGNENEEGLSFTGHMLPPDKFTHKKYGQTVDYFILDKVPPLFNYAKQYRQINSVPMKALDLPFKVTNETMLMRNYILQEIGIMKKNPRKYNHNIKIETILKYAGIKTEIISKQLRSKKVGIIEQILQHLRDIAFIKGYDFAKKGRTLHAIKIIIAEER